METTQANNDTLLEGVKISEKWFNNLNAAMMDIYNKQLKLTTGYYTNFLNSALGGNNSQNKMTNPFNMFFNTDTTKAFWFPFGNDGAAFTNPFLHSFDKAYKDMLEYNRNLLTVLNSELKNNVSDWSKVRQEYREFMEKQIEVSKKIVDSMAEAFDKQGNFSTQLYKEAVEKINHQMDSVIKQDQDFLTNVLNTVQNASVGDEKKTKESVANDTKKKTNAVISA
jgi:hypothetical protein